MSKYVKNLISDHLRKRFDGIDDALLVNMIGLDANTNNRLRAVLESQDIRVLVIKNSLARRATEGTALAPMFDGLTGTAAVCWSEGDLVDLAKEITKLTKDSTFAPFETRGGVMDGEKISAEQVLEISKWPNREEQLALLVGQILGPGAKLAAQLNGPGGALASQVAKLAEGEEEEEVEQKAEEVEQKAEEVEQKAEEVEQKAEGVEQKAEGVEQKAEGVEQKAVEVEQKAEEVEQKAEEVDEGVEKKSEEGE